MLPPIPRIWQWFQPWIYISKTVFLQAFCLPILQTVHETLADIKEGRGRKATGGGGGGKSSSKHWQMNVYDRTEQMGKFSLYRPLPACYLKK